jgi:hypothetical protein
MTKLGQFDVVYLSLLRFALTTKLATAQTDHKHLSRLAEREREREREASGRSNEAYVNQLTEVASKNKKIKSFLTKVCNVW